MNHYDFCPFPSFDSLPGIDDLNSYEMPHSKKLVNAKEAFKVYLAFRSVYSVFYRCRLTFSILPSLPQSSSLLQSNVDSSPTCEIPGWHTSLAQRSLKYLDAPLSSAYEEPPLTFVSASGRGLWGQSGDWDLRTGSGEPVKVEPERGKKEAIGGSR